MKDSCITNIISQIMSFNDHPLADDIYHTVTKINDLYFDLIRHEISNDDLVELKFILQKWRMDVANYLVTNLKNNECKEIHLKILQNLHIYLSDSDLEIIVNSSRGNKSLEEFLEELLHAQNRLNLLISGKSNRMQAPTRLLPIKPIIASKWNFARWSKLDTFSKYFFTDSGGVTYRNVELRPGDLLITSLNRDPDGLYTSIPRPASFSAHAGFFVILSKGGKKFPSVLEVHEHGVRAIPLNQFLDKSFTSYVELYRLPEVKGSHFDTINHYGIELMDTIYGYNFNTVDDDPRFLGCTEICNVFFKKIGLEPISMKSFYKNKKIVENFELLGFSYKEVLNPMDFVKDSRTKLVGIFDNGQFYSDVARYAGVMNAVGYFSTQNLSNNNMPVMYLINCWGIKHIRKKSILGIIFRIAEGFNENNFPKGAIGVIGLVQILENRVAKIVHKIKKTVKQMIEEDEKKIFSLEDFLKRSDLEVEINKHNSPVKSLFS